MLGHLLSTFSVDFFAAFLFTFPGGGEFVGDVEEKKMNGIFPLDRRKTEWIGPFILSFSLRHLLLQLSHGVLKSGKLVVEPSLNPPHRVGADTQAFRYVHRRRTRKQHASDKDAASKHDAFTLGQKVAQEQFHRLAPLEGAGGGVERIEGRDSLLLAEFRYLPLHNGEKSEKGNE